MSGTVHAMLVNACSTLRRMVFDCESPCDLTDSCIVGLEASVGMMGERENEGCRITDAFSSFPLCWILRARR